MSKVIQRVCQYNTTLVVFLLFFLSCTSSRKTSVTQKQTIDSTVTTSKTDEKFNYNIDTSSITTTEVSLFQAEDSSVKEIVVDTFSNDGKLLRRTITKERLRINNQKQNIKLTVSDRKTQDVTVENKKIEDKKTVSIYNTNKSKSSKKIKLITGLLGSLFLLFIIYVLYRVYKYYKNNFPSKFYPF